MKFFSIIITMAVIFAGCKDQKNDGKSFKVIVENPLNIQVQGVLIIISPAQLKGIADFNPRNFVVMDNTAEIASQYNFNDKTSPGIVIVLDSMKAGERRILTVNFDPAGESKHAYKKRTQAELSHKVGGSWTNREYVGGQFKNVSALRVPPEHKDHSWFIRYEGPGWESDKVGYRFYLDQRNAIDVFGKLTPEPILQQVGLDGFDSYHEMQPWGMDVMKVGKSLGVGSIGSFENGAAIRVDKTDSVVCEIAENGDLLSSIITRYYGWELDGVKINIESNLSIHAATRLSHQQLELSAMLKNICTGIVKDPNATLLTYKGDENHYGYLATYGNQSLNSDALGLVVFFRPEIFQEFTSDEFSHIVTLKPESNKLDYYFAATWVKEPGGIANQVDFEKYIRHTAELLANPVNVKIHVE